MKSSINVSVNYHIPLTNPKQLMYLHVHVSLHTQLLQSKSIVKFQLTLTQVVFTLQTVFTFSSGITEC